MKIVQSSDLLMQLYHHYIITLIDARSMIKLFVLKHLKTNNDLRQVLVRSDVQIRLLATILSLVIKVKVSEVLISRLPFSNLSG